MRSYRFYPNPLVTLLPSDTDTQPGLLVEEMPEAEQRQVPSQDQLADMQMKPSKDHPAPVKLSTDNSYMRDPGESAEEPLSWSHS